MRRSIIAALAGLVLIIVSSEHCWADDVEPENLQRGLLATYRDASKANPTEVVQLDPTIALSLQAHEASHPRLDATGGTVTWKGYINILRGGSYRFSARLRGGFNLHIGGKEVLAATVSGPDPVLKSGNEVQLEAGVQPLEAEFTRLPGVARLEVLWQSKAFQPEPLHNEYLGHLPAQAEKSLKSANLVERGRFLVEEAGCVKCHRAADDNRMAKTLASHEGPDLSQIAKRVHPGWIERWLAEPQQLRPGAIMPKLFDDDSEGAVQRHAVVTYLASLGEPLGVVNARNDGAAVARGKKLFASAGCIACHGQYESEAPKPNKGKEPRNSDSIYAKPRIYPLSNLGSKTSVQMLTAYLTNPLAVDPGGRMPHVPLQPQEAQDLARYLCLAKDDKINATLQSVHTKEAALAEWKRLEKRPEELQAFADKSEADQWKELGKRLMSEKGCTNCHNVAPAGKALDKTFAAAELKGVVEPAKHNQGCLADDPAKRGKAPRFPLDAADRAAVRAFLAQGFNGVGSPAPAYEARAALQRFNCLACHTRDSEGGLTPDLVDNLRKFENAENSEAVSPPTLTGIAHKLRPAYIKEVLTAGTRARPWMSLRMPQFGEPNVGHLAGWLGAQEGTDADDTIRQVKIDAATIEAGRFLVGKGAFGCISCHDIAGIPNSGTRGPDLAGMNQRVRYDWYTRWLEQPQRIQAGTRMPSIFSDGKSAVTKVHNGHAAEQAEAMWGYLALGNNLPLPDGVEFAKKGIVLAVTDKPVILRTFMPDAGSRAIAVGFPGNVAAAFDAQSCRMAYSWTGPFLDASPVWGDRGGNPAHVLGSRFWTAPAGCPLGVSTSGEPPDFTARAGDPAYGAGLPEGKVFPGTPLLHFKGYGLDKDGSPIFHYVLQASADRELKVAEKVETPHSTVAAGIGRRFTLDVPEGQTPWLVIGEGGKEPRFLDSAGAPVAIELKADKIDAAAATRRVVLPQDGDKVTVFAVTAAPEGSEWRLQHSGARWQLLLRIPPPKRDASIRVDVNIWVPYRDDPALLKDLFTAK